MSTNNVKGRILSEELGLKPVKLRLGPWDTNDKSGMQISIEMLRTPQAKGRNLSEYVQFDSIQNFLSV